MRFAAGFWPPRFRNLGEIRGRILAAEISKSWPDSRQDFGLPDLGISARFVTGFWPPRFSNLGAIRGRILAAEI